MAMITCHECREPISSSASSCPKCGARVPRTKWWLWVPLGLIGLFFAYGLTIPEYEHQARELRKACEALVGGPVSGRMGECRRIEAEAIARGKASGAPAVKSYEPPVDQALVAKTSAARAADDAAFLQECRQTVDRRKSEYRRLMASREYWSAALTLRRCADLQEDSALKGLVADAERKQYVMEIESPATSRDARNQAIEALLRDYPEAGKKYAKLLRK